MSNNDIHQHRLRKSRSKEILTAMVQALRSAREAIKEADLQLDALRAQTQDTEESSPPATSPQHMSFHQQKLDLFRKTVPRINYQEKPHSFQLLLDLDLLPAELMCKISRQLWPRSRAQLAPIYFFTAYPTGEEHSFTFSAYRLGFTVDHMRATAGMYGRCLPDFLRCHAFYAHALLNRRSTHKPELQFMDEVPDSLLEVMGDSSEAASEMESDLAPSVGLPREMHQFLDVLIIIVYGFDQALLARLGSLLHAFVLHHDTFFANARFPETTDVLNRLAAASRGAGNFSAIEDARPAHRPWCIIQHEFFASVSSCNPYQSPYATPSTSATRLDRTLDARLAAANRAVDFVKKLLIKAQSNEFRGFGLQRCMTVVWNMLCIDAYEHEHSFARETLTAWNCWGHPDLNPDGESPTCHALFRKLCHRQKENKFAMPEYDPTTGR